MNERAVPTKAREMAVSIGTENSPVPAHLEISFFAVIQQELKNIFTNLPPELVLLRSSMMHYVAQLQKQLTNSVVVAKTAIIEHSTAAKLMTAFGEINPHLPTAMIAGATEVYQTLRNIFSASLPVAQDSLAHVMKEFKTLQITLLNEQLAILTKQKKELEKALDKFTLAASGFSHDNQTQEVASKTELKGLEKNAKGSANTIKNKLLAITKQIAVLRSRLRQPMGESSCKQVANLL